MPRYAIQVSMIVLLASFLGCKKRDDVSAPAPAVGAKDCRIAEMSYANRSRTETLLFHYDGLGNPMSVIRPAGTSTGASNFYFRYDNAQRLIETIASYDGGSAGDFRSIYFYSHSGLRQIQMDSTYHFPLFTNGVMTGYWSASVTYYSYDRDGRIIRDSTPVAGHAPKVNTYTYDTKGNLVGRHYDNRVNLHRTHQVWMFLDRDYSVNNPFVATSYNEAGLPTSLGWSGEGGNFPKFLGASIQQNAHISYVCR